MKWLEWHIWRRDRIMRLVFGIKRDSDANFYRNVIAQAELQPEYWSKVLMFIYRFGRYIRFHGNRQTWRYRFWWQCYYKWNIRYVQGKLNCHLPTGARLGFGTRIYHPYTIVINGKTRIGRHAKIRHNTTIGNNGLSNREASPQIGDYANIGANANIFGPITIGRHVTIGGGSVVTKSFPDKSRLVGVPAKNIAQ